jgi:hypothetical protein
MLGAQSAFYEKGHHMGRRTAHLAIALLIFAAIATAASAAVGPLAKGYYGSAHPRVSVYVLKPATHVQLYIGCFTSANVVEYWDSPNLRLKNNEFSFDGATKISTENGATFGTKHGTVLFTGKFSGGKFRGTAQIVGSTCPKRSYTATYKKNGAGTGG